MATKKQIDIEIDKLTNSIENTVTGESFETVFERVSIREIRKKDWTFDWNKEIKDNRNEVYKMTTLENRNIIKAYYQ